MLERVSTLSKSPRRRRYLDLCCLALGRFHHNISPLNWDSIIRFPINEAAQAFWDLDDLDIEK